MRKGMLRFTLSPLWDTESVLNQSSLFVESLKIHSLLRVQTFVFEDDIGSQNKPLVVSENWLRTLARLV
jgi:hypothetical protein